jgi:hypothetical protein
MIKARIFFPASGDHNGTGIQYFFNNRYLSVFDGSVQRIFQKILIAMQQWKQYIEIAGDCRKHQRGTWECFPVTLAREYGF